MNIKKGEEESGTWLTFNFWWLWVILFLTSCVLSFTYTACLQKIKEAAARLLLTVLVIFRLAELDNAIIQLYSLFSDIHLAKIKKLFLQKCALSCSFSYQTDIRRKYWRVDKLGSNKKKSYALERGVAPAWEKRK